MNISPADLTTTVRARSDTNLKKIISGEGRFMPAWRGILSESDAEALVSHIRLLSQ